MPRPKSSQPAYRYHVSGQARVDLDGRTFYLGPHGSKESWARYHALLAEYNANGQSMPADVPTHQVDAPITVRCVTGEFRQLIETKYANCRQQESRFKSLCTLLEDEYGDLPADEFGPRKLADVRDLFVASGNCRRYVNEQTRAVVTIFRHAVSRELVDVNVIIRLDTLEPLRRGQTKAKESKPVQPVDIEAVRLTAKNLSPTLKAMVRIQAATGMRPSEVCKMRPVDIEKRPDGVWIYRPASHKTAHHGKTKAVPLVGDAKLALKPFLDRDREAFCFSPKESTQWYRDQRTAARTTPMSCGDRPGTKRKANPKRQPGEKYNKDSYRKAIQRAAERAGTDRWFPYQLRHTAATVIREALGVEAAQAMIGHSRAAMTEHYAKVSLDKAIKAAQAAPTIDES